MGSISFGISLALQMFSAWVALCVFIGLITLFVGTCRYLMAFVTEISALFSILDKTAAKKANVAKVHTNCMKKQLFDIFQFHSECRRFVNFIVCFSPQCQMWMEKPVFDAES